MEEKEMTLEENFAQLQILLEQLEADNISLEDAFRAYSSGMELIKACNSQIDQVEKRVLQISGNGNVEPF